MSGWQGFDQRKICPKCGDYQTRVARKRRQAFSAPDVLFRLVRYLGVILAPLIAFLLLSWRPINVYLLGLFFTGFVGLVVFFAYRSIYSGGRKAIERQSPKENWIGYSLHCRNCGYTWEMTLEEWDLAGRKEKENFISFPARFPASKGSLNGSLEGIEWKPPNPGRGVLIVTGFLGASVSVSLLLYGVFWAKTHPDNPYAVVVNGSAALFALFVYTGLIVIFKPKANKIVLLTLILVTLIGLALRFLLA